MAGRKFQMRRIPTLATLAMVSVMLGLGFWQVERLEWKTALLDRLASQMAAKPVPLPEKLETPADWEYRPVSMAGQYLYDREFMVGPRTLDGKNGFHLVVPFRRASGGVVFVNRGWISQELRKKADRPEGIVQVEGFIQLPHKNYFTPENDTAKGQWYWLDPAAMGKAAKIENVAPIVVATPAAASGVYPAGGALRVDIPNDHKKYAIFWFGMAFVMLAVYILSGLQPADKLEEKNAGV